MITGYIRFKDVTEATGGCFQKYGLWIGDVMQCKGRYTKFVSCTVQAHPQGRTCAWMNKQVI